MCFALFAWFARAALLAGIADTATGKALSQLDWSVFKCSHTTVVFQTAIFLILVVRNNKWSSGIDEKTATAFPKFVYVTVILSYVSVSKCSLHRLNP